MLALLFMTPTPWPSLFPLFKIIVSSPIFSIPPPFKVFQTVPPPSPRRPPWFPNPTHQPSLHMINEFKQISKGWFYQFTCWYLSKINFNCLNPFTNISGYLDLWDIFMFIFRQLTFFWLEWLFSIKLWWQKRFFYKCITRFCKE